MEGQTVAIYLDFENLAISAETVYPSRSKPLAIEPIVDFATTKGIIATRKAYADWSKHIFAQYQGMLMEQGFELIHLPETNQQGKNGSDVRLAVDVMEYMEYFPGIDTFVIGSGDTDFIPLIQRLRSRGKAVVTLGFEHSVGTLVKRNSTEFRSLEELIGRPEAESPSSDLALRPDPAYGRQLMLRFLRTHTEDEDPIFMSRLKQQLLRLDPSFSEKELGFSSFKSFVQSFQGDLVENIETRDQTLPVVYFRQPGDEETGLMPAQPRETAQQFLTKKLRYQKETPRRMEMSQALIQSFLADQPLSMNQMFEQVSERVQRKVPKSDIKKFINTLFTGGAFKPDETNPNGPLLSRPLFLADNIESAEILDQIYIRRIGEILQSRYTDLDTSDILELLI
ncbi:MAG: hypothetical protein OHK0039_44660 [Bacteroidia bacterium]